MVNFIAPNTGPTDPNDIAADAFAYLQAQFPDWKPSDGNLEVWQIMALARIVSIATQVAGTVPLEIFKYFGGSILGLQPVDALAATATTTWTVKDTAGYTIPAGTNVAYQLSGDTTVAFETMEDVTIAPGASATDSGAVRIQAVTPGSAGNGLGPSGLVLVDALSFVTGITATGATTGGYDAETDLQYASRLISELGMASPTPILGKDFAVLARNIQGVWRAVGLDNYNPADHTFTNERMVGVAAVDEQGQPISATLKTSVSNYLNGMRETNFVLNLFDPTYTTVNVAATIHVYPTYDSETVRQAVVDAVTKFVSPATWGVDDGDTVGTSWTNTTTFRYTALVGAILAVPGVRWIDSLTINSGTADITLAGDVALPELGTLAVTVSTS